MNHGQRMNEYVTKRFSYPEGTSTEVILRDRQKKEGRFMAIYSLLIFAPSIAIIAMIASQL